MGQFSRVSYGNSDQFGVMLETNMLAWLPIPTHTGGNILESHREVTNNSGMCLEKEDLNRGIVP